MLHPLNQQTPKKTVIYTQALRYYHICSGNTVNPIVNLKTVFSKQGNSTKEIDHTSEGTT